MSDTEAPATATENKTDGKPVFNEKEQKMLIVAWSCLKSGLPDIDYDKFTELGGFNTKKTATNTWGKLKAKLFTDENGNFNPPGKAAQEGTPAKGKKGAATPKKRVKDEPVDENDAEDGASPAKKAKKSPTKRGKAKTGVKDEPADENDAQDGASPAKKTRKLPAQSAQVKAEANDEDDADLLD